MACEISITTSAEHELGNFREVHQAGFDEVVLLSLHRGILGEVREALYSAAQLSEKDRARLHFMSPEEFFTFLDAPEPAAEETTIGGYKVKVKYRPAAGE